MSTAPAASPYKTWRCLACGFVYDEAEGWPDDGISAGTRWEDIPRMVLSGVRRAQGRFRDGRDLKRPPSRFERA
jgi:rubredoxin